MYLLIILILIVTSREIIEVCADDEYAIKCEIILEKKKVYQVEKCISALFSPESFDYSGKLQILDDDFGCSTSRYTSVNSVGVVKRGSCSFEMKVKNAAKSGYKALIIINSDPIPFPVGASDPSFKSSIPVAMVGNETWGAYSIVPNARFHLSRKGKRKENSLPTLHQQLVEHIPVLKVELLALLSISIVVYFIKIFQNSAVNASSVSSVLDNFLGVFMWLVSYGLLVLLFFASRITTLRILDPLPHHIQSGLEYPLLSDYHHTETDELIFETLIRAVHHDRSDYTLQGKSILHILNLSKENYDHPLFIHPPFFVYVAEFLHYSCGIPLPIVPLLFQVGSLLCLPILLSSILPLTYDQNISTESSKLQLLRTSLKAGLLFLICPLTWFCAQKVWIDNALLFACTLTWTLHVWFFRYSKTLSTNQWIFRHCLSGLLFGGLALNTKITAIAQFPVICFWSLVQEFLQCRKRQQTTSKEIIGQNKKTDDHYEELFHKENKLLQFISVGKVLQTMSVGKILLGWLACGLGAIAGHAPWLLWYHGKTGRWLPSAWPSPSMLMHSVFVRSAVMDKPWYFYLQQCCTIMPLYFIALLVGCAALCVTLIAMIPSLRIRLSDDQIRIWLILSALWTYLFAFLAGLTVLGMLGGGFQTRFLLPISPIVAVIVAIFMEVILNKHHSLPSLMIENFIFLTIIYSAIHGWYYGVQYPTRYADISGSGLDMLGNILGTPMDQHIHRLLYDQPERVQAVSKLLQSYGYFPHR